MEIFKAVKKGQTKSTGITDYSSIYNSFDKVSYHKVYQNYYPERNYRSDILGCKVSDCIDIDDCTTNSELVRGVKNKYYVFYNKKFTRIKRSKYFSFKGFVTTCYWINNYYYMFTND